MSKVFHGDLLPPGSARDFSEGIVPAAENVNGAHAAENVDDTHTLTAPEATDRRFWYMFSDLVKDDRTDTLLTISPETVKDLIILGHKDNMVDPAIPTLTTDPLDPLIQGIPVPTAYTFLGQFVDHDITFEEGTQDTILSDDLTPLSTSEIEKKQNTRSPNLDLDSIYGSNPDEKFPPRHDEDKHRLKLAKVDKQENLPERYKDDPFHDLYRGEPSEPVRKAIIGDPRNDENIVIAQLHVAFLRAHNAIVKKKACSFDQARQDLIQHYQWIVLEDFLPRVVDPMILRKIRQENKFYPVDSPEKLFMPLEFSVAAFRFGHSKIRQFYHFNEQLGSVTLRQLFKFTHFGGDGLDKQIPGEWVIDWKNFLNSDEVKFFSRPIDTRLAKGLLELSRENGLDLPPWKTNLAVRNLLRGYLLRIPTGQAVAAAIQNKMPGIVTLDPVQIASAVTDTQRLCMKKGGFLERTPLWFYILAEAVHYNKGHHLGPVGSVIVAETLIGILRHSKYSILKEPGWKPTIEGKTPGKFDLEDLLILAGVYESNAG